MSHFAAFGYGSLVNHDTLPAGTLARPARISGWRRAWRVAGATPYGNRCSLTAIPDQDCQITGAIIVQPVDQRASLAKREGWYRSAPLVDDCIEWLEPAPAEWPAIGETVGIFVARDEHARSGDKNYPVMLSYIDTVLAGYRDRFGTPGVEQFMETTADWHVPIFNDRDNPRYPRAVIPTVDEKASNDRYLEAVAATILERS